MSNSRNADYDAIVIGAGHNALVCAAYLAKAGQRVAVFERSDQVGGACITKEIIPGFRFDLGASAHTFIRLTPVSKDLSLDKYGLEYVDHDPLFFMPFPDNTYFALWRSVEQTCEGIARFSPVDAENYRRFCREWTPIALVISDLMMTNPSLLELADAFTRRMWARRGWNIWRLPQMRLSLRQFLNATFQTEKVKALLGWLAAQAGFPPDQPGTALFAVWQTLYHVCGISHPRGGSGMLTQALARYVEAHGGTIQTNAPIERIIVENGVAVGVETLSGQRAYAAIVVSGIHIKTTAQLLGNQLPASMGRRISALRMSNGGGVALRIAAKGLPEYRACADDLSHTAIQLIAPSMNDVEAAWEAYHQGGHSPNPLLAVMTFSASESALKPTVSIWAQYYPYHFQNGAHWDSDTQDTIINQILDTLSLYAPNVRDTILDLRLQTPLSFESEFGLINGDIQHIGVSLDQMFLMRPGFRFSQYKTPIRNLYLTGASTHPGGGITGMPGLNAARAILKAH